ncbi:MAG: DUF1552 domain-containing protein [Verrucomicrobia bacterium]|nr:MAG: DUF1552 domain-containing protein [Verrucomicrobiota bacterium]
MTKTWQLPRRTFLKGLGTAMALPLLEAMVPSVLAEAAAATSTPRRMAFVYVPNGMNMADWLPTKTGTDFELPMILQPLEKVRSELNVLSNLGQDKAAANGDGAGDHARASAAFLTGCQPRKTSGADIRAGVSVDQVAAQRIGNLTRLPSLELGCDVGQQVGNCDSGYSCAYSYNISWRSASSPLPPEIDPKQVFERLFNNGRSGENAEIRERRERRSKSVLDFVLEDARSLSRKLGSIDRRKLDEYMTAVRELEQRIQRTGKFAPVDTGMAAPTGIPSTYPEHIRLMYDLMALGFQTDSTRVSTFVVAHDGDNKGYPFIGVPDGHHDLSHHGGNLEKKAKIAKINRFHLEQFAYFIEKLKNTKEGSGSLLDNCMIVYGSGIEDGNSHHHSDLPVLLAGRGGGTITTGRHVRYTKATPMNNLFLSMLDRMDVPTERLGDSTARLTQLT